MKNINFILKFIKGDDYRKSLFSSYIYNILSLIASIFITRHILNFFNDSEYGVFILLVETVAVFEILDLGFSGGIMAFVSREIDDYTRINKLVSTLFFAQLLLSFVAVAMCLYLIIYSDLLFNDGLIEKYNLSNALILASFSLFLTMISKALSEILYARRKISNDNYLKVISLMLRLFLIFVLLEKFKTIEFLIIVSVITHLLNILQSCYLIKKNEPFIEFRFASFDFNVLKEVWKVSMWFAIGAIASLFIERFDNILTGSIIDLSAITILVVNKKLFDIAKTFIFQISNNLRPFFSKIIGQGNTWEAFTKFKELSLISVLFSCIIGGTLVIVNENFVSYWVSKDKYGGLWLNLFLFLNLVFHSWKISYRAFLSSSLIAKELSISSFIEGFFNLLLGYYLGLKYGVNGIVASTFITGFLVQSIAIFMIFKSHKIESLYSFLKRNVVQLLICTSFGVVIFLILILFKSFYLQISFWIFVLISLIILVKWNSDFSSYLNFNSKS